MVAGLVLVLIRIDLYIYYKLDCSE